MKVLLIFNFLIIFSNGQNLTLCGERYCLYSDGVNKQYNSIEEARSSCSQMNNNGWLLEVYDEGVKRLVDDFVSKNRLNGRYVPLNIKVSTGGWMWNNKMTNNVHIQNQISITFNAAMVAKINGGINEIQAQDATAQNSALCYITNSNSCQRSNSLFFYSNCYFAIWASLKWYEAQNRCIQEGGSLAMFDDLNSEQIKSLLNNTLIDRNYWIGLARSQILWVLSDNIIGYSNWKNNNPYDSYSFNQNQTYFSINTYDNYWFSDPWNSKHTVICMIESTSTTMTRTTTTPTTIGAKITTTTSSLTKKLTTTTLRFLSLASPSSSTPTVFETATNTNDPIGEFPTSTDPNKEPSIQQDLTIQQKIGIGVGVGVSLFVLVVVAVVVVISVCLWCKRKERLENQRLKMNEVKIESTTNQLNSVSVYEDLKSTNNIENVYTGVNKNGNYITTIDRNNTNDNNKKNNNVSENSEFECDYMDDMKNIDDINDINIVDHGETTNNTNINSKDLNVGNKEVYEDIQKIFSN